MAVRWLDVRDHLRRNEVFDPLPPAAVAIWDRYLGYGAATGVAGTASRVLGPGSTPTSSTRCRAAPAPGGVRSLVAPLPLR